MLIGRKSLGDTTYTYDGETKTYDTYLFFVLYSFLSGNESTHHARPVYPQTVMPSGMFMSVDCFNKNENEIFSIFSFGINAGCFGIKTGWQYDLPDNNGHYTLKLKRI